MSTEKQQRGATWQMLRRLKSEACKLDPIDRWLATVLADFANEDGEAWPSIRTLVRRSGIGRTRLFKGLGTLCGGPLPLFIKDWSRSAAKGRRTATYVVIRYPEAFAEARALRQSGTPSAPAQEEFATRTGEAGRDASSKHQQSATRTEGSAARTAPVRGANDPGPPRGHNPLSESPNESPREHPTPARAQERAGAGLSLSPLNGEPGPEQNRSGDGADGKNASVADGTTSWAKSTGSSDAGANPPSEAPRTMPEGLSELIGGMRNAPGANRQRREMGLADPVWPDRFRQLKEFVRKK